jgi:hypothetical protein
MFQKQREHATPNNTESRPTANSALLCYDSCLLTMCGAESNMNTFIADSSAS